jgi:flagellar motor switch protein FliM
VSAGVPSEDAWTLRVAVAERVCDVQGALWFLLDAACVERLLTSLSASRARATAQKSAATVQPLPARLQFTLTARLLDTEIPLGVLLDTHIGDVIPIRLKGADVLIGSSRLFTASVAENRGKLCLTSFEDVE